MDLQLSYRGFDTRPLRFQVTALGKLFALVCLCHHAVNLVPLRGVNTTTVY